MDWVVKTVFSLSHKCGCRSQVPEGRTGTDMAFMEQRRVFVWWTLLSMYKGQTKQTWEDQKTPWGRRDKLRTRPASGYVQYQERLLQWLADSIALSSEDIDSCSSGRRVGDRCSDSAPDESCIQDT